MVRLRVDRKIKASTLIEMIIALLIILVVFGIATTIYIQINAARTDNALVLEQQLETMALNLHRNRQYEDQTIDLDNTIVVDIQCEMYRDDPNMVLMTLSARDHQDKKKGTYHELFIR